MVQKSGREQKLKDRKDRWVWLLLLFGMLMPLSFSSQVKAQDDTLPCAKPGKAEPGKLVRLYILIDQSQSANHDDPDGHTRLSMLSTIVEFAAGYGWLTDTAPYIYVYGYSTAFGETDPLHFGTEHTILLWPSKSSYNYTIGIPGLHDTDNDLDDLSNNIAPKLLKLYDRVEDLPVTLNYIKWKFDQNPSSAENALVVLLTQGELLGFDSTSTSIDELLKKSAEAWAPSGIPIAVFTFNDFWQNKWETNFIEALDQDSEVYLGYRYERDIWGRMLKIYSDQRYLYRDGNQAVYFSEIESGQKFSDSFPSEVEELRIISLVSSDESLRIGDEDGHRYKNNDAPDSSLIYWEFDKESVSQISSKRPLANPVHFMYKCIKSTITPTIITDTPTPTPTPTSTPSLGSGGLISQHTAVAFWSVAFIFILILALKMLKLDVVFYMSLIAAILDAVMVLGIMIIGLFSNWFGEFMANILAEWAADGLKFLLFLLFSTGAGGAVAMVKRYWLTLSNTSSPLHKFIVDYSPAFIGLFVFLALLVWDAWNGIQNH